MEHNQLQTNPVPDAGYLPSGSGDPVGAFDVDDWIDGQSSVQGSLGNECFDFQSGYCPSGNACPYSHDLTLPSSKYDSNGFDDDHMIWAYDLENNNNGITESICSETYSFAEDPRLNGRILPRNLDTVEEELNTQYSHSPIIFPEWEDSPTLSSPTISAHSVDLQSEVYSRSEPSSSSHASATRAKRPRTQFSESARSILENALALELYPDTTEIASIAQRAQLSPQQVKTWFGNQRSRKSPKNVTSAPSPICEPKQDVSIPRSRLYPSPLTRRSLEDLQAEQGSPTSSRQSPPSSAGSSVTSRISGVTITSATSVHSIITCISRSSRKGRRKFRSPQQNAMEKKTKNEKWPDKVGKFRCSFCEQAFTTRYAWKRHEETLHLQLHQWKCKMARSCEDATTGSSQLDAEMFPPHIRELDTKAVMAWYNASVCAGGDDKCTFFRKDNLVQHLRQVHKVDLSRRGIDLLDVWKDEVPALTLEPAALACPYCPRYFGEWDERLKHVEQHFHREPAKERIPRSNTCPYCFEQCASNEERLSHIETHTHGLSGEVIAPVMSPLPEEEKKPENYYQCNFPACVESRADIGSLVKHISEHLKPQVLMTMCGQFRCRECLVTFPEVRNLLAHVVLAHTDTSLYRCHCACTFSSPDGLAQHVRYTHLDALSVA